MVAAGQCCSIGEMALLTSIAGGGITKWWVLHIVMSGCIIISIGTIDQHCQTGQEVPIMIHGWLGTEGRGIPPSLWSQVTCSCCCILRRRCVLYHHPCYCTCSPSFWLHTPTHQYMLTDKEQHTLDLWSMSTFKIPKGFQQREISLWWWM